jgi:hypothetical protein
MEMRTVEEAPDIFLAKKSVFTTTKQIGFRQPNSVPVLLTRRNLY